ncbi:MAG: hypothetical protein D6731_16600 [Planctomycetota bacterium]|nr:MAG: hypothetical protein D6731_16600 [Planctomycetota bacterium]
MYLSLDRYSRPATAEEALRLVAESEGPAAFIAGGTDLNAGDHEAIAHLVDLQALPMKEVRVFGEPAALHLGSLVTLSTLRRHPLLGGELLAAVREAAGGYANLALQNRSTLGGRVMAARVDHDLPAALLALGARLHVARLRDGFGVAVERVAAPEADRTALDGGLLVGVEVPLGEGRSAHRRFGRSAVDVPLACVSACRRGDRWRVVAGVQAAAPPGLRRLRRLEELVAAWGSAPPPDWREAAREACRAELPEHACRWISADYRRDLTATLAVRALAAVLEEEELA